MPTKTVLPPTGQEVSERDLAALYSSYASAVLAQNGYIKPLGGIMPLEKRKYTVLKPLPGKIAFQSQEEEYYTITLNDLIQEAYEEVDDLGFKFDKPVIPRGLLNLLLIFRPGKNLKSLGRRKVEVMRMLEIVFSNVRDLLNHYDAEADDIPADFEESEAEHFADDLEDLAHDLRDAKVQAK